MDLNTLSWIIYASEVVPNIREILVGLAAIAGTIGVISSIIWVIANVDDDAKKARGAAKKAAIIGFVVCALTGPIGSFVPSKDTILLMAASELGENVIVDEANQETVRKLRQVIDGYLDQAIQNLASE